MKKNRSIQFLFILVMLLLSPSLVRAQASPRLQITSVDASEFPLVRLRVIAANEDSSRLADISGLSLSENGTSVETYEVGEIPVGTEVIFVIDANSTIDNRDEAGGLTRREKVRDSISRYATEFMDDTQLDRVSIVVPAEDGTPSLLLDRAIFPNAVLNEINFYENPPANPSPVNGMLSLALEHAAAEQGRFQAVVLFSDAAELGDQLDYQALIDQAQAIHIPIFGVILGSRADDNEIENVMQLAGPTRGGYIHMPEPDATDPIYALVQSHKPQYELSYQSGVSESGIQQIDVDLGGASANAEFEVAIEPPLPEIVVDNSRPIRRVVPEPDAPLTEADPADQPIVVRITWPDGHPRSIKEVTLQVNGNPQPPIENPEMTADGLITLNWDISDLDEGSYQLSVIATDDLGLMGNSGGFPMVIEVDGRAPVEQPGAGAGEDVETPEEETAEPSGGIGGIGTSELLLGLLILVIVVGVISLIVVFMRRSGKEGADEEIASAPPPIAAPDHEATQVIRPAFAATGAAQAYLEPVENAPEHKGQIPIPSNNVTIGRDPNLAQIVFADKSVSRLHARILVENGIFQLYDEGSASGTYINFEQVGLRPQALKDNDQIHIGRVHLKFHAVVQAQDSDSTQVMPAPMRPTGQPQTVGDQEGLSTQPYMPNQPPGGGQQPPAGGGQAPAGGDEDDVSTQPYMPHSPKR